MKTNQGKKAEAKKNMEYLLAKNNSFEDTKLATTQTALKKGGKVNAWCRTPKENSIHQECY